MSTLSFDVISEVIQHLDINLSTDISTLRALSTTCHALLEPSQRALFSRILIILSTSTTPAPNRAYIALHDLLLNTSPHLASYPRHLDITFNLPHPAAQIVINLLVKIASMASIQTLRLCDTSQSDCNEESFTFASMVLEILPPQHPLLELRLVGYGILPSSIFDLPVLEELSAIDVGEWRIGNSLFDPIDTLLINLKTLAVTSLPWVNPGKRMGDFLWVSPHVTRLELEFPFGRGQLFSI